MRPPQDIGRSLPKLDGRELTAVFAGAFVGAILRSALAQGLPVGPGQWPWATFAVNIAGALLLGFIVTHLHERRAPSTYARSLLASGFCGTLTTFSTMIVEVLTMIREGRWTLAAGYVTASVLCGFAALQLATVIVRRARSPR